MRIYLYLLGFRFNDPEQCGCQHSDNYERAVLCWSTHVYTESELQESLCKLKADKDATPDPAVKTQLVEEWYTRMEMYPVRPIIVKGDVRETLKQYAEWEGNVKVTRGLIDSQKKSW